MIRPPARLAPQALLVLATLLAATPTAQAEEFELNNVTLLAHIPLSGFPSLPGGGNDCWGYVSPSGREYALMGLRNAVAVVEITDAANPVIVGSIPHQDSNWCDIRTYGTYVYAVNESGGGLDVIDLSAVDSGVVTLVQRVTDLGLQTCHNISVDVDSGFLYLCASNIFEGRLVAMDLSDPADPVIVGNVPSAGGGVPHDAQVVTFASGPNAGRQIAYSSSGTDGIEIYDVTDKSNMFRVSVGTYPNRVFTHQAWLHDDAQHLYVNDEFDFINETVVMDVSDITTPTYVSAYTSGVDATDHNVFFHQDRIYEAEYRAGMRIFDASDPVNPAQIGWIDTFPGDDSAGSGGVWGVWPFFPSGKVIVSDKDRGLFVVWPDAPPLSLVVAGGTPPDLLAPDGDGFTVEITAQPGHALDPSTAVLVYDDGSGAVETPMTPLGGDDFQAAFGPVPCGALVQYHVRASTTAGIPVRDPPNAPGVAYVAVAADSSVTVLADDAEFDLGWQLGVPGDTATVGQWTRDDPISTDAQSEVDHTPGGGVRAFFTGQGAAFGNIGDADVDGGATTLLSPLIDLSGSSRATIAYWRWYHNSYSQIDADEGLGANEDVFTTWISNDDGGSWTLVESVGPTGPETLGGWFLHAFDVGSLVPLTDQMRLRFVASDFGQFSIVEAAVDDVLVVSVECGPWTDLGHALAGTHGEPSLVGTGTLLGGQPVSIELTNALESTSAFLFLGLSALDFSPFYGGTLVPDFVTPPGQFVIASTDAGGALTLGSTWPPGIPPGFEVYMQYWITDAGGPFGFSASNAIRGTTP